MAIFRQEDLSSSNFHVEVFYQFLGSNKCFLLCVTSIPNVIALSLLSLDNNSYLHVIIYNHYLFNVGNF
jgi:hypothetical protein